MDFSTVQFHVLLLFVYSVVVLAIRVDNESPDLPPVLENLRWNSAASSKEFAGPKWGEEAGSEGIVSSGETESPLTRSENLAWRPSKFDRFVGLPNDIPRERGIALIKENLKPNEDGNNYDGRETRGKTMVPATLDELEDRNANIYNPLLNLDHYPIPAKKYTVIELENMNANNYNPYLN